ncbi:hypothetical protein D0N36_11220 [Hymenobacter lapidiphilus]|uniref:DUF6000 family protein n=1 Tax=Hymenobacter sp. CCM 8763 TaxID=2303334 RepID=UPI000E353351|nr:DUF6000 family protein [Hymenobacter sp. CCM 8763]RFP64907.1 hypothetical protein D0N36_11220 [Hymenobacter sp. CCM 8763]
MAFLKLWTKLFGNNDEATEIALHVSGATSRNQSNFDKLESYRNEGELSEEFIDKWVMDFYMNSINSMDEATLANYVNAAREITPEIVKQLLGDFDWRPRIVGAYFAAIKNYSEFKDIIGVHLLKSEVCYAGYGYALALAVFADEKSKSYLTLYLDYYLKRKDLWYNQGDILAALFLVDTDKASKYLGQWNTFVKDKPYWSLESNRASMVKSIEATKNIGTLSKQ